MLKVNMLQQSMPFMNPRNNSISGCLPFAELSGCCNRFVISSAALSFGRPDDE
jgi:hypothetical protein